MNQRDSWRSPDG